MAFAGDDPAYFVPSLPGARANLAMLEANAKGSGVIVWLPDHDPISGSPEQLRASRDEVSYLLDELNRVLPEAGVGEEDVVATFAGARPLLAFSGSANAATREHRRQGGDRQ